MPKHASGLPLEIAAVTRANLLWSLEAVRGCLKTTSMLWMRALGVPVLSGIVVGHWSKHSASAVERFCRKGKFSELLLRVDKQNERWARRRGGFLIGRSIVPATVKELQREGRIAILLEPASPYADQYSLAGITVPEQHNMIVEVVGPGFDASDILRGDLRAHERWQLDLELTTRRRTHGGSSGSKRIYLTTTETYVASVRGRLAKIGARTKDPSFPDEVLKTSATNADELADEGTCFLKATHQTTLLNHAKAYAPIPQKHLASFARNVENLLLGLAGYGIHLGPTSFAASVIPRRGLVFWDFFPARKQEAALLYGAWSKKFAGVG